MTTPSLLSTLRALEQAATKGPWSGVLQVFAGHWFIGRIRDHRAEPTYAKEDVELAVALRNAAPAILDALEAAAAVIGQNVTRPEVYDIAGDSRHAALARALATLAALEKSA